MVETKNSTSRPANQRSKHTSFIVPTSAAKSSEIRTFQFPVTLSPIKLLSGAIALAVPCIPILPGLLRLKVYGSPIHPASPPSVSMFDPIQKEFSVTLVSVCAAVSVMSKSYQPLLQLDPPVEGGTLPSPSCQRCILVLSGEMSLPQRSPA